MKRGKRKKEITYNLRRRKRMGGQEEDTIEMVSTASKKTLVEEGDGLIEEQYWDDNDEALLLPMTSTSLEEPPTPARESWLSILAQITPPYIIAGIGTVIAGLLLDHVQHWEVFKNVTELFIMVPALLGLKGNLEMTLASRLSTHSNLGHLDTKKQCISHIVGNLALTQCQASVVGFLAAMVAIVMNLASDPHIGLFHPLLLVGSSLATASIASFFLGLVMIAVILLSRKMNMNPDNIATPIAASLGDITTLLILSTCASFLYDYREKFWWLGLLILAVYAAFMPIWMWLTCGNESTKKVLKHGWSPVIAAMIISSLGGIILDKTVAVYAGIAVYQPVINGVGGNLVAVQASRLSTALHSSSTMGRLPREFGKICINPIKAYFSKDEHALTARILLCLVLPGQMLFITLIYLVKGGHTSLTFQFALVYNTAALMQVVILLYVSYVMITWLWKKSIDPDNSAIPYLTAFGDLLGTAFLAVGFHILYLIGDRDADLGD